MACEAINSWTFTELVSAFVDLSIAYCLLCASALSYFASKLLGLFGLCLPCPCQGQFWNNNNNTQCLQRQLSDLPYEKISAFRSTVRTKSPFETLWNDRGNHDRDDRDQKNRELDNGEKRRSKSGPRRRRRVGGGSSVSSYDTLRSDARNTPRSPPSIAEDAIDFRGGREAPADFDFVERDSLDLEFNDPNERSNLDGEKNTVRVVEEEEEEEERLGRSELYVELEKERSAAASAADEAMAMILRLQEEKASVEMEARQYQRMIEAKAAYDAEEMNILKEILLRREREKHFLEKEVEGYRQMILGNQEEQEEEFESDSDNPISMLHRINDSLQRPNPKSLNRTLAFEKELAIPELVEESHENPPSVEESHISIDQDSESRVYDVHVIDDGESKKTPIFPVNAERNDLPRRFGSSSFNTLETLYNGLLPPTGLSRGKSRATDLRRNSMSVVDYERAKLDNEVESLRERLKLVQKGREKLNFSSGHIDREKLQLQLLEGIAGQLREIRQLGDPGKTDPQASLPPSYSKVMSKERRWRSSSLNVHQCT